jgi:hypothetical protein
VLLPHIYLRIGYYNGFVLYKFKKIIMKKLLELVDVKKLGAFLSNVKGKKPLYLVAAGALFIVGAYMVQKGYISADLASEANILHFLDSIFGEAAKSAPEVVAPVVDTLKVVDSVSLK